ncbi:MAG: pyridoxal-phosphate dependent enzyme, partial [Arenicella sp.]|nr:pyridoxal-phosphate dependent enzyme [Arenicella sp.]
MTEPPTYIEPFTGKTYPLHDPRWRGENGSPLLISDLPGIKRSDISSTDRSIWRYAKALPIPVAAPVSLGEGCTPLLNSAIDGLPCKLKLEWFAPTGSFKDRGSSVMVSLLKQQGINTIIEDSSGNGGASIAAYGAAAGMKVEVFVPESTPSPKIAQTKAYGAEVVLVPGPRQATEAAAIENSAEFFYASHNWQPFFLQGTKTLGYEIWEDLGFRVPDNIVIPASAGSNLLGCHIAFSELMRSGEIDRLPKLFVSQPANCAPLHNSFQAGAEDFVDTDYAATIAEGTAI